VTAAAESGAGLNLAGAAGYKGAAPASGLPVVGLHGAPGCRLNAGPDAAVLRRFDYLTYDRPGYGRTTRQPGRTVAGASSRKPKSAPRPAS
jgi:pimeloyl-ACP methyl ester carboxylesterase